jgi:hypothetical protein
MNDGIKKVLPHLTGLIYDPNNFDWWGWFLQSDLFVGEWINEGLKRERFHS